MNSPVDAKRFLEIVHKQSERLSDIIDDLLSLSRLEQEDDAEQIVFEDIAVSDLIKHAFQACELEAKEQQIEFELKCENSLIISANSHLLEQAIVKLLSNALKTCSRP